MKQVKDYEEIYEVDSNGNVYVCKTGIKRKPVLYKDGYYRITLSKNGVNRLMAIHRIVAMSFIDNPKNKPCVNHKNGIKTDNRVDNLEWVTYSENNKHAYDILNRKPSMLNKTGINCPNSKKIIQLNKSGEFIKEWNCAYDAMRELKIHQQNIGKVCLGKRKFAGGFIWKYI